MPKLILASQSESRNHLLAEAGYTFTVMPSNIEEIIDEHLPILQAIQKLSLEKAEAVAARADVPEDAVIVAADSVVVFQDEIIGKPKDEQHLIKLLTRLSGQAHDFITGYTIINMEGRKIFGGSMTSTIQLKQLSPQFIKEYVQRELPYTKAGGYSIRENRDEFVESYAGDYTNIVGLPMTPVEKILTKQGIQKS